MFVGIRKTDEYEAARRLRHDGMSIKRIASKVGVSPSSVHAWTRDIELTPEQHRRNVYGHGGPCNPEDVARRGRSWSEKSRSRRRTFQAEGRLAALRHDPVHIAGCMLYWAEGSKDRNTVRLVNSDVEMIRFFVRFLRGCFEVPDADLRIGLKFYSGNGLAVAEIERHWLEPLDLPAEAMHRHIIDVLPTSSSGQRVNKIPYGVCTLSVRRSTWLVQHIYGAIQEYGAFDEPAWLD